MDEEIWKCIAVERLGKYYFQDCCIPVKSDFNCDMFDHLPRNYEHHYIVKFLRYSWPVGTTREVDMCKDIEVKNYNTALNYSEQLTAYLEKEIQFGSVMDPFYESPFLEPIKILPLHSTKKKSGIDRSMLTKHSDGVLRSLVKYASSDNGN